MDTKSSECEWCHAPTREASSKYCSLLCAAKSRRSGHFTFYSPPKDRLVRPVEKTCLVCGSPFIGSWNSSLCSPNCKKERYRVVKQARKMKQFPHPPTCAGCGETFSSPRKKKYCCAACRPMPGGKRRVGITERGCVFCGNTFMGRCNASLCSPECKKRRFYIMAEAYRKSKQVIRSCSCGAPLTLGQRGVTCPACRVANARDRRVRSNLSNRIRAVMKRQGRAKNAPTLRFLGCTVKQLRERIESMFDSRMSWENYGLYGWHIDHIIPMSAFDLNKPDHRDLCCNYLNLRPLWWDENLSKHDHVDVSLTSSAYLIRLVDAGVIEV